MKEGYLPSEQAGQRAQRKKEVKKKKKKEAYLPSEQAGQRRRRR